MPGVRSKRVTLYDVARQADVSYQTVSRVINNHPNVAPETRHRILQIIETLGYRPSHTARSLATQRSCTLGIVTFGAMYYGPSQMMFNVERAAKARGYSLRLSTILNATLDELCEAVGGMRDQLVDGLIMIMPTQGIPYPDLLGACGQIPFVQTDTEESPDMASVVIDQRAGSRMATQHLLDLGHTAICEISGPLHWFSGAARHESWQQTLRAAGVTPGLSFAGDWSAAGGYAAAKQLLAEKAHFTALVVGNDQMALGAIRALREHGLRVPEDVSVVGFDDLPEAAYFDPPLTTVRQNFAALGEQSVEYLLSLIDDPETRLEQRTLQPEFVERLSTRPLR
jgi:LacI family transcriptional regulator